MNENDYYNRRMLLEVENLRHAYGKQEVVRGLRFSLARGAIGCLLGPSGCGKTTVLRCIAGFEASAKARSASTGKVVSRRGVMLPPERRRIGMVFQDYALFPHLTVAGNIAFGLHGAPARERAARVARARRSWSASSASLDKYPHEISGGQQQRVALARALAPRPELLLLDEPFSNLDVDLRERLSLEVRDIIKASGATAVLVTHDQQEAFAMADEIGVMHEGRIQQWDSAVQPVPPPRQPLRRRLRRPGRVPAGDGAQRPPAADRARRAAGRLAQASCRTSTCCCAPTTWCTTTPRRRRRRWCTRRSAAPRSSTRCASRAASKVLALVPSHHNHALGEKIGIRLDVDHVVAFRPEA